MNRILNPITLLPLTARTASGAGSDFQEGSIGSAQSLLFELDVTAQSGGTPTLDVAIQAKMDGQYVNLARFSQTAAATGKKVVHVHRNRAAAAETVLAADPVVGTGYLAGDFEWLDTLRVKYTIAGTTPSYTFSVTVTPLVEL